MSLRPAVGNRAGYKHERAASNTSSGSQQEEPSSSAGSFGIGSIESGSCGIQNRRCVFCEGGHLPGNCFRYNTFSSRKMTLQEKGKVVRFRCLRPGHWAPNCKSNGVCSNCQSSWHHTAFCFKKLQQSANTNTKHKQTHKQSNTGATGVGPNVDGADPKPVEEKDPFSGGAVGGHFVGMKNPSLTSPDEKPMITAKNNGTIPS